LFLDKNKDEFKNDVLLGLSNKKQKSIPSKYLYDDIGSELFERITLQPEYYPTKTEIKLLDKYAYEAIRHIHKEIILIELGSGSSKKTKYLFNEIMKKQNHLYYFPIDISFNFLNSTVSNIENTIMNIIVKGIPSDYINGISHCNNILFENNIELKKVCRLIVFLGSSIGNFEIEEARNFLKDIRFQITNDDYLLIGFDLDKDISLLESAYNDREGVTAMFNLNLLNRINKELGGNFIIKNFSHRSFYNKEKKRIEMHIISGKKQQVFITSLNKHFNFEKDETIHTENSYKYSLKDVDRLISRAGFTIEKEFYDENSWYDLVLLKPK
jgi:dimethylhistidine N-methyltransferase